MLALDSKEEAAPGSRALRLDQQLHERGVAIVGLQETRTIAGRKVTDHYHVFSGGGSGKKDKQHFGCEVWLHKTIPLAQTHDGVSYKVGDFKVAVVAADPRRLILRLTGPLSIVIATLHAPCRTASSTPEDIQQWWGRTHELLEPIQGRLVFLACDANAPLGMPVGPSHGPVGAEPMNPQGEMFVEFSQMAKLEGNLVFLACDAKLGIPSTFQCHTGTHGTWRHPSGIFAPQRLCDCPTNAVVFSQKHTGALRCGLGICPRRSLPGCLSHCRND